MKEYAVEIQRNPDLPPANESEVFELASEFIDDAVMLAEELEFLLESHPVDKVFRMVNGRMEAIAGALKSLDGITYVVSGKGLLPLYLADRGSIVTVHADINCAVGTFGDYYLIDPYSEHVSTAEVGFEIADNGRAVSSVEYSGVESEELENLKPRAVIEFCIGKVEDAMATGGLTLRTGESELYAILDAASLKVDELRYSDPQTDQIVLDEDICEYVFDESDAYTALLKTTRFRRFKSRKQIETIENRIADINRSIKLSNFTIIVAPDFVYCPTLDDSKRALYSINTLGDDGVPTLLTLKDSRIDSIDLFYLQEGSRIYSNGVMISPDAGLCIVAESEPPIIMHNGTLLRTVWLPLGQLDKNNISFLPNSGVF